MTHHRLARVSKKGINTTFYCGPMAVATVAGKTGVEAVRAFKTLRGTKEPIVGVHDHEITLVLRAMGYTVRYIELADKPLFKHFRKAIPDGYFRIIRFWNHVMALGPYGEEACDPASRFPVPASEIGWQRGKVHGYFLVKPKKKG